jgi:beta-mannosidase
MNTDIWVAPTWAGIEYDGRWKLLHSMAQSIYSHIIIAAYHNVTTGHLSVSVISDLWSPASGTATLTFMGWDGSTVDLHTPSDIQFKVGALNSTQIFSANLTHLLEKQGYDPTNVVLKMDVSASAPLPNSGDVKTTFRHENWFSASPLNTAQLQDPGLEISHSAERGTFNVTATSGVAAWVWIDYPAGAVVTFDSNAFWLAKGEGQEVGYNVKQDGTDGRWVEGVVVRSMWDQTQP